MAKTIKNIDQIPRKPTAVTQKTDDQEKKNRPAGGYPQKHERELMERWADDLGVSAHSLRQFAIRFFMEQYQAGQVEIKTEAESTKKIIF